jgi:hypothetical protein
MSLELKIIICFIYLTSIYPDVHSATIFSASDGNWKNGSTWIGGVSPGPSDDVVVNHLIVIDNSTGNAYAQSVTIQNVVSNSILSIRGSSLTTGSILVNGIARALDTQLTISNSASLNVNGSITINRQQTNINVVQMRLTGSAQVTISGDLNANYLDGAITNEGFFEVSVGNISGDSPILTVNGNINLEFNSANSDGTLALFIANNSRVLCNGNISLTNLEGGNSGSAYVSVNDNALLTINGDLSLNYRDSTPATGSQLSVSLNSSSRLSVQNTNLISQFNNVASNINNYIKCYANSVFITNGSLTFSALGTNPSSINNRIEMNGNASFELRGLVNSPSDGTFEFLNSSILKLTGGPGVFQTVPRLRNGTSLTKLIVNNTSGNPIQLFATTIIDIDLDMTNGKIASTPGKMLVFNYNATSNTGNQHSFITGPVQKLCRSGTNTDLSIPLGQDTIWAPLAISNVANADNSTKITGQYFNASYATLNTDGTFDHLSGREYWNLSISGTTPTLDVSLFWKDACYSDIQNVSGGVGQDLFICRYNSAAGKWGLLNNSTIDPSSSNCFPNSPLRTGKISATGVSSFGAFTFASQNNKNALPVELINFKAKCIARNKTELEWTTASEVNSNHFQIEKSHDGMFFERIAEVPALGTSEKPNIYNFTDMSFRTKSSYYKLVEIDNNGNTRRLAIVSLLERNEQIVNVFPNPISKGDYLNIILPELTSELAIHIMDSMGKVCYQQGLTSDVTSGVYMFKFELSPGIYYLRVYSNEYSSSIQLSAIE